MPCSGMMAAVSLGLLQGVFEWLPVSSGGVTALVHGRVCDGGLAEGVEYALWLHAGTVPAALAALRREAVAMVRECVAASFPLPPVAGFLLLSMTVSGLVGLPLVLLLAGLASDSGFGPPVTAAVGFGLLVTGVAQLRRARGGDREMGTAGRGDALLAGLAQGLSVLPGFSRSGLTLAALLARGFRGGDALALSFLMSVPAGLGGALYAGVSSGGAALAPEFLAAVGAAFVSGLLTVRFLLRLAARLNLGWLALAAGVLMLLGPVFGLVG